MAAGWWTRFTNSMSNSGGGVDVGGHHINSPVVMLGNALGGHQTTQSQPSSSSSRGTGENSPFFGLPTPAQTWSRMTGGNAPDQGLARDFNNQYGMTGIMNNVNARPMMGPGASSYLTGNFSPSQLSGGQSQDAVFNPIDLDFGQQVDEESPNGYPGITSENTYAPKPLMNTVVAPTNTVANISGGGARDAFAGGGQSSARGGSSNWGNTFQSLGDLGTQGGGLDPQRNQNVGEQRLRQKARAMLEKDPNDARAQDWFARMRENATAGK